jgi:uncharacterized protein YukE
MGEGFEVTPHGMEGIVKLVRGAAADLRSVRKGWDGKAGNGAGFFGTTECGKAYESLQDATFTNLGKHVEHLSDLADNVASSARTYSHVDDNSARNLEGGN